MVQGLERHGPRVVPVAAQQGVPARASHAADPRGGLVAGGPAARGWRGGDGRVGDGVGGGHDSPLVAAPTIRARSARHGCSSHLTTPPRS